MNSLFYVGEWERDQKHGKGTYWYQGGDRKGDCYIGNWRNGQKHGYGVYIMANGSYFEGQWDLNIAQGDYVNSTSPNWSAKIIPVMPPKPRAEDLDKLVENERLRNMQNLQNNNFNLRQNNNLLGEDNLNNAVVDVENDDADDYLIIDDEQ